MNIDRAKEIVIQAVVKILEDESEVTEEVTENAQLIGTNSLLDSMKLVEVCLLLEDIAEDYGFEFDWTSDEAMSKSRSMFRTITSLAQEFSTQAGS